MLLAQAGNSPAVNDAEMFAVLAARGITVLVFLAVVMTVQIFFLLTLLRCYKQIAPKNQVMNPGLVWLNLIPCLGTIWIFLTTIQLADSLQKEYADRHLANDNDFGRTLGIIYPVLSLLGVIPYIGVLTGIGALVCFIRYWIKIADYTKELRRDTEERGIDFTDEPRPAYE